MENKHFGFENEAKWRPQTNISVDVAKKLNDARNRGKERAHFILENKHFVGLENQAKMMPKTKISVDVATK